MQATRVGLWPPRANAAATRTIATVVQRARLKRREGLVDNDRPAFQRPVRVGLGVELTFRPHALETSNARVRTPASMDSIVSKHSSQSLRNSDAAQSEFGRFNRFRRRWQMTGAAAFPQRTDSDRQSSRPSGFRRLYPIRIRHGRRTSMCEPPPVQASPATTRVVCDAPGFGRRPVGKPRHGAGEGSQRPGRYIVQTNGCTVVLPPV